MSGFYRYRQPEDVDLLPGYSGQAVGAAASFRMTLEAIERARDAAVALEAVLDGDLWQGTAFEAFAQIVRRRPLVQASDNARAAMESAAACLSTYADAHRANQNELYHWRHRLRAVDAPAGYLAPVPDELAPELHLVNVRIDEVYERHRASESTVMAVFNDLDDQPMFAEPPPSNLEKVGNAATDVVGVAREFGAGVFDGVTGLVDTIALIVNPMTWRDAWNHREEILAVMDYAIHNPGEAALEFGTAMLDVDLLLSNPSRWMGARVPDLLLAFGTMGTGTAVSTGSKLAAAGRKMDKVVGSVRRSHRVVDKVAAASRKVDSFSFAVAGERVVRLEAKLGKTARMLEAFSPGLARGVETVGTVSTVGGLIDGARAVQRKAVPDTPNRDAC